MTVEAEKANILITGTPGCGKTTLAQKLAEATGLRHVHVGDLIKREKLYDEYDEEYDSYILNEDKLCDAVAPEILQGGAILDYHSCDFFGEDWFDLIIVLRTETKVLYDRLTSRQYSELKIKENVECEIMQVALDEAKEAYPDTAVVGLQSNTEEDMSENINRIRQWLEANDLL
ncbi:hypothetical protein MP638_000852 [Amoeboaphelidium occidentale]|nr:hypothetical protein MP638_000852 [Amoeboaphelidium occidentale]